MEIKGTVESIEDFSTRPHPKKIITIIPDHRQKAKVEFRGRNMNLLKNIEVFDEVVIEATLEGKISKNSGIWYNNIVGQFIKIR